MYLEFLKFIQYVLLWYPIHEVYFLITPTYLHFDTTLSMFKFPLFNIVGSFFFLFILACLISGEIRFREEDRNLNIRSSFRISGQNMTICSFSSNKGAFVIWLELELRTRQFFVFRDVARDEFLSFLDCSWPK